MAKKYELNPNTVIIAGTAIAGFLIVRRILVKAGIVSGRGEQAVIRELQDPGSPWKPAFYKSDAAKRNNALLLQNLSADQFAKIIYDALNWYADDTAQVMSVFSRLQTQSQVSFLADVFLRKYKADLLSYLQEGSDFFPWNGLSDDELLRIKTLVQNLPKYKK